MLARHSQILWKRQSDIGESKHKLPESSNGRERMLQQQQMLHQERSGVERRRTTVERYLAELHNDIHDINAHRHVKF